MSRGGENRTPAKSFGDSYDTISPHPYKVVDGVGGEMVALIPIHHTPNINGRLYKRPFMLSFTDNSVKSVIVILIY